jgi:hypothetical protein
MRVVYGGKPQCHRAHGGRTDGDDYLHKEKMFVLFFKYWI